jgi:hypothetical protein
MTSRHEIVLHNNAIIIIGSLTQIGVAFGNKETMKPIIAKGKRQ